MGLEELAVFILNGLDLSYHRQRGCGDQNKGGEIIYDIGEGMVWRGFKIAF